MKEKITPRTETSQELTPWLTLAEAAEYLKLSKRTFQNYVYQGRVPVCISPTNTKRFRKNDLDRWMTTGGGKNEKNYR